MRKLELPLQSYCKNLLQFIKCKLILKLYVKQVWSGASPTPRKSKKWRKLSAAAPSVSQPQAQEGWNISGFWLVRSHCLCVMWRQHGEVCTDNKSYADVLYVHCSSAYFLKWFTIITPLTKSEHIIIFFVPKSVGCNICLVSKLCNLYFDMLLKYDSLPPPVHWSSEYINFYCAEIF